MNSITQNRKMSAVILEFAQPLLDQCETFQEEKEVITISVLAWNLSLSQGQISKKLIASKLKKAGITTINGKPLILDSVVFFCRNFLTRILIIKNTVLGLN